MSTSSPQSTEIPVSYGYTERDGQYSFLALNSDYIPFNSSTVYDLFADGNLDIWADDDSYIKDYENPTSKEISYHTLSPYVPSSGTTVIGKLDDSSKIRNLRESVPKITLLEFKPSTNYTVNWLDLFQRSAKLGETVYNSLGANQGELITAAKNLTTAVKQGFNSTLSKMAFREIPNKDSYNILYDVGSALYRRIISGVYMNKYILPFNNIKQYLEFDDTNSWNVQSALESKLFSTVANIIGVYAPTLRWDMHGDGTKFPAITFTINLFNRNYSTFLKNYTLLNSLIPGAMWSQNGLIQTASTLYDVDIEGRTRFFFAAAKMSATFEGRIRRYPFTAQLQARLNGTDVLDHNVISNGPLGKAQVLESINVINQDFSIVPLRIPEYIPDVYKLEITIQSLLPNNLNTYLMGMIETQERSYPHSADGQLNNYSNVSVDSYLRSAQTLITEVNTALNNIMEENKIPNTGTGNSAAVSNDSGK